VYIVWWWNASAGGLSVSVEGPSKAQLTCKDSGDGSCLASYLPTEVGQYKINVKFAEEHIPGSPFTAKITPGGEIIIIIIIIAMTMFMVLSS